MVIRVCRTAVDTISIMNVAGQNDDTFDDASSDSTTSAIPVKSLITAGIVLLALIIGWGARSWTASNSSQPLPLGPVVENRVAAGEDTEIQSAPTERALTVATSTAPAVVGTVTVHVAGHVNSPGVYDLPANSRVKDAIARAGGLAFDGDGDSINQATLISDGQRIQVPAKITAPAPINAAPGTAVGNPIASEPSLSPGKRSEAELAQNPIDLNTASAQELSTLPGVGPLFGARIVAYRQQKGGFRNVAELGEVPGIGPKRLAQLQPFVTVR